MALTMRLRKQGRTNRPFYRLVVTDKRNKRDGKYVEALGWYDPCCGNPDEVLMIKVDRAQHWVDNGVEMSPKAENLLNQAAPAILKGRTAAAVAKRNKRREKRKAQRQAS